jgi:hypothetical protein
LRRLKEILKPDKKWAPFCEKYEIDIKKADYEIEKLGDIKDDALLKFGLAFGYEINKIKYLKNADSQKLGVEVKEGVLYFEGEEVPVAEAPALLEDLKDKLKREKKEREAERKTHERRMEDERKHIQKLEKEISKFEKDAKAKGISLDEDAFLQQMENRRIGFEGHMLSSDPERMPIKSLLGENPTRVQTMAYIALLRYMRNRAQVAYDTATSLYGGPEDDDNYKLP